MYRQLSWTAGIGWDSCQIPVVVGDDVFINLATVWFVGIGLLNLFPIPMLDGGLPLYYGIETVRGRPLGERADVLEVLGSATEWRST